MLHTFWKIILGKFAVFGALLMAALMGAIFMSEKDKWARTASFVPITVAMVLNPFRARQFLSDLRTDHDGGEAGFHSACGAVLSAFLTIPIDFPVALTRGIVGLSRRIWSSWTAIDEGLQLNHSYMVLREKMSRAPGTYSWNHRHEYVVVSAQHYGGKVDTSAKAWGICANMALSLIATLVALSAVSAPLLAGLAVPLLVIAAGLATVYVVVSPKERQARLELAAAEFAGYECEAIALTHRRTELPPLAYDLACRDLVRRYRPLRDSFFKDAKRVTLPLPQG